MAEEAHERIAELREVRRAQRKGIDLEPEDDDDDDEHEMEVIVVRDWADQTENQSALGR